METGCLPQNIALGPKNRDMSCMTTPHAPWRVTTTHAIFASDPAPLWKLIAQFDGLPALDPEQVESGTSSGQGVGMLRTLHIRGGGSVIEELIAFHPEQFRLSYAMKDPVGEPWEHYFCTMQLQALGAGQTHLMATGYFQPREGQEAAAREALAVAYHAVFIGLARALGTSLELQPG